MNYEEIIRSVFVEMDAGDFCGCYEGDLYDHYPEGIEKFITLFRQKRLESQKKDATDSQASHA